MTARRITVGLIDYGAGNLASVARAITGLGWRCRVSRDTETLAATDLLLLPGVGAYPAAMAALHQHQLVDFIQTQARHGQPLVGICLGMQLLAHCSSEHRWTAGLGLIPGQVQPLQAARWHIGWNAVEVLGDDALLKPSDGQALYFNHSFVFQAPAEYTVAVARLGGIGSDEGGAGAAFTVAVRRGSIVGLQFHPEKSQQAGRELLRQVVTGLLP